MFESANVSHVLEKDEYKKLEPQLREDLLETQLKLAEKKQFQVIVIIGGMDGTGKADSVHKLYEWMDPHHLETQAFGRPTVEERLRPRMWRYWRALPAKGKIGFFFGSWYHQPLHSRIVHKISDTQFEQQMQAINRFESMVAAEGALILKFWFNLAKPKRGGKKSKNGGPDEEKVALEEWGDIGKDDFQKALDVGQSMARLTSTGYAPWIVVPSEDHRYRNMTVGKTLLEAMRKRLDNPAPLSGCAPAVILSSLDSKTVLDELDLSLKLTDEEYNDKIDRYQRKLTRLTTSKEFENVGLIAVFEGNDAAGKGSTIRRITGALDPRIFKAHGTSAPSQEELAQPYLWRFWRRIPKRGNIGIFDRSWYGRVLVERVEGFCTEQEWLRAYEELNDFELQLSESGLIVVKYWLAISKEEQLKRFKAREKTSFKKFKITDEDWRNREKWNLYAAAVGDMVDRTSTAYAPWNLIEAEDKLHARVKTMKILCDTLEKALKK